MDDFFVRLPVLLNLILPLLFFIATVYLALHMVFARLIANRESPVLWFFSVMTNPLTRPVRALLPHGASETRVRAVALGVYVMLWMLVRVILAGLVRPTAG